MRLVDPERRRRKVLPFFSSKKRGRDSFHRIQIEVLLRRNVGTVRAIETRGDEKRTIPVLLQQADRFRHDLAVGVLLRLARVRRKARANCLAPARRVVSQHTLFVLVHAPRIDPHIPRRLIVQPVCADVVWIAVVVDLADPRGEITVPLKELRHRDDIQAAFHESAFCRSKTFVASGRKPVISEVRLGLHSGNWQ